MAKDVPAQVAATLQWLERRGSQRNRDGMARYGIVAPKRFGVSMGTMQSHARALGRSHELALALWKTGWHEARILASFVDEPARVTVRQMDTWTKAFDNWAICDTICGKLWDKTPHAWGRVNTWATRKDEFVKRAAFALIASLAVHDKKAPDAPFLQSLKLIERAASDDRNFVKKGVSWALRSLGNRSPETHAAAMQLAGRLANSSVASERWIGKDVIRDLSRKIVLNRIAKRRRA